MKKFSAEVTRYMMDAMAYAFVACTVAATGEEPTDEEIDSHARALMALYCRSEGIEPTYDNIASSASVPDCYACCKRTEADDWHDNDEDKDDNDSWHDEDEDDWDDDEEDYEGDEDEETHISALDGLSSTEIIQAFIKFLDAGGGK